METVDIGRAAGAAPLAPPQPQPPPGFSFASLSRGGLPPQAPPPVVVANPLAAPPSASSSSSAAAVSAAALLASPDAAALLNAHRGAALAAAAPRRPSGLTPMLTEGFTTFTSGIGMGWHAELASIKFRQAVLAECNATMIFVAMGVASVVWTHDAASMRGTMYAENVTQTSPPFGMHYGALGVPVLHRDQWLGAALFNGGGPGGAGGLLGTGGLLGDTNGTDPGSGAITAELFSDAALSLAYNMPRQLNIAFCFGFMICVLVFSTGSISGGNLNPAVTISLALTQKMSSFRATCYVVAQCVGAACGAALVRTLAPQVYDNAGGGVNAIDPNPALGGWTKESALGGEILMTALLVFTICAAADVGREKNNKYQVRRERRARAGSARKSESESESESKGCGLLARTTAHALNLLPPSLPTRFLCAISLRDNVRRARSRRLSSAWPWSLRTLCSSRSMAAASTRRAPSARPLSTGTLRRRA
jgi:hypothetical protein